MYDLGIVYFSISLSEFWPCVSSKSFNSDFIASSKDNDSEPNNEQLYNMLDRKFDWDK